MGKSHESYMLPLWGGNLPSVSELLSFFPRGIQALVLNRRTPVTRITGFPLQNPPSYHSASKKHCSYV